MLQHKRTHRHPTKWQLQQAKQQLSKVIRLAEEEGPKQITKSGVESAWLISAKDYHELIQRKDSLLDFFQNSPYRDTNIPVERRKDLPRQIKL